VAAHAQLHLNIHPEAYIQVITIYSTNPVAIQAITNLHPYPGQPLSRAFCSSLILIFSSPSHPKVKLEWCPSLASIVGINCCIGLAHNTIAYQKSTTKQLAMSAWQVHWHNPNCHSQSYLTLLAPPLGKLPPAIHSAASGSCLASATFICLVTSHAFVGSYTAHFHPCKATHYPKCGVNPQSVAHVLQLCPCFVCTYTTHLFLIAPDLSLSTLFGTEKGGRALIAFLEETKACFKPWIEQPFDPG